MKEKKNRKEKYFEFCGLSRIDFIKNLSTMDAYESVILIKQEVFVYKIPPRTSNRGYR